MEAALALGTNINNNKIFHFLKLAFILVEPDIFLFGLSQSILFYDSMAGQIQSSNKVYYVFDH